MGDPSKSSSDKATAAKTEKVLEGEFTENPQSEKTHAETVHLTKGDKKTSRLPWMLSAFLAAFIAGLFAFPWFEQGLYRLFPDMMPKPEQASINTPSNPINDDIATLIEDMRDLRSRIQLVAQGMDTLDEESNSNINMLAMRVEELEGKMTTSTTAMDSDTGANSSVINTATSQRIKNLADQLVTLEADIDHLKTQQQHVQPVQSEPSSQVMTDLTPLTARLEAVEQHLNALETAPHNPIAPDSTNITLLQQRLDTLERLMQSLQQNEGQLSGKARLAVLSAHISQAIDQGAPFQGDLDMVQALMFEQPAIDRVKLAPTLETLTNIAPVGIATRAMVRDYFLVDLEKALARSISSADADWWQKTKDSLSSIIQVRRTDTLEGGGREALLNRAELALKQGDIVTAFDAVNQLPAADIAIFRHWLALTDTHLKASKARDALLAYALKPQTQPVGEQ